MEKSRNLVEREMAKEFFKALEGTGIFDGPLKRRNRIEDFWRRHKAYYLVEEEKVPQMLEDLGVEGGRPLLYLGPYTRGIRDLLMKSGKFTYVRSLDAVKKFLNKSRDPYRIWGMRRNGDGVIHDEFLRGPWHLTVKDRPVVFSFEFTPFLKPASALLGMFKVATVTDTLVHIGRHQKGSRVGRYYIYPRLIAEGFGLDHTVREYEATEGHRDVVLYDYDKVVAMKIYFNDDFRRLARIVTRLVHTTPLNRVNPSYLADEFLHELRREFPDDRKRERVLRAFSDVVRKLLVDRSGL